jgi:flagellar biosynthesis/type III secretory pathway M-ring protein FliF/YscJ
MVPLVLLVVLLVIGFLLYQSVQDARRRADGGADPAPQERPKARRAAPKPREKPKPKPRKVKVDEEALEAHVEKLRSAIANDLISMDEAVASVVRQTDGAVGEDAARKLLTQGA